MKINLPECNDTIVPCISKLGIGITEDVCKKCRIKALLFTTARLGKVEVNE